jgi:hypothetical protein
MIVSESQWAFSFSRQKLDAFLVKVVEGHGAAVADLAPAIGPIFRDLSGLDPRGAQALLAEIEQAEAVGEPILPGDDFL